MILSQHPSILISSDTACKRESPLSLHYRLFIGKHVPNIVMTSGKETAKTCIEKKIRLESRIKAVTEKGNDDNVVGDVEEEEIKRMRMLIQMLLLMKKYMPVLTSDIFLLFLQCFFMWDVPWIFCAPCVPFIDL